MRSVVIIRYNQNVTKIFCKFSCIFAAFCKFDLSARFTEPFGELFGHPAGVFISPNHSVNRSAKRHGAPEQGNKPRRVPPLPSPLLGGALVSSVLCLPSLVVVAVCCWWLLLVALYDDLRQVAGACNMVRYYIIFNRARN